MIEAASPPSDGSDRSPGAAAQRQSSSPSRRNRALRTDKENICLPQGADRRPPGGDQYEAFARTERSKREKRRPQWNTKRWSNTDFLYKFYIFSKLCCQMKKLILTRVASKPEFAHNWE